MEEYDGLVTFFPDSGLLLNESYLSSSKLNRLPTTDRIIQGTMIDSTDRSGILPYPSILNLYAGGCQSFPYVNSTEGGHAYDESFTNCTMACGDKTFLFLDWQTQWNCLTLANMAINKPYPHKYNNSNTTGDTARILDYLAVTNLTAFDSVGVLKMFFDYADRSSPYTQEILDNMNFTDSSDPPNIHALGIALSHVCDDVIFILNPDLAGPGVSHVLFYAYV